VSRAPKQPATMTASPRLFAVTKAQMAQIAGQGLYFDCRADEDQDDALALACSALMNASLELRGLSPLANDDDIPAEAVQNLIWRLSERLGALAEIAWSRGHHRGRTANDSGRAQRCTSPPTTPSPAPTARRTSAEIEELLEDGDRTTEHIIASQTAEQHDWRLESFRDALGGVRQMKILLTGWLARAKRQPMADVTPKGGFGEHH
jgi:hypothetical protein